MVGSKSEWIVEAEEALALAPQAVLACGEVVAREGVGLG